MISRIKHLKVFLNDPNKKGFLRMIKEIFIFTLIKKELPTDYFRKFLYRKDIVDYKNYLSLKQYYSIINSPYITNKNVEDIMHNKLSFAFYCEKKRLLVPLLASYNFKNTFYFNKNIIKIKNNKELVNFYKNVFNYYDKEKLFLKPINGGGGYGCILIEKDRIEEHITLNAKTLLNNNYIHQEVISQHSDINKMYSKSVNTLRIDTYLDKNENIHVISSAMRFGIGDNITDNAGSGGFYVSVDSSCGRLKGKGIQDLTKGGNEFLNHPNTHTKIDDFKIPFYNEALDLAKKSAEYFPTRLIGWDIAISETAPIIIEGNPKPSLHLTGTAFGGYLKHPLIQEILKEIK
ncbi:hypothetical protein MBM09_10160 [Flaviramulus sp. BrNp1-15]|uniref:sugar-transfer associated ATP-grasp domain-containing protein n=1 Tax=Flaviramulus sp. BrNp1-15 TaxID=2916754 RepID=UPI001EE95A71|nr:sugar-transfer associated ATP-grasp domain-containing protein [Flaviramulus sp. BrNp1-15]ULC58283.1 hypothetical protein MBM09_10160 [Flaviramulus sp. BrNp1-15]